MTHVDRTSSFRGVLPGLMATWAAAGALFAAAGGGAGTLFTSKQGDFSVRYPAGWETIDGPNDTILLLLAQPAKDGGVPTRMMAVVIHPAEGGKAPAARDVEQELLGFFKGIAPDAVTTDPQPAKLGGEAAERVAFRGHDKQNAGADTRSVAVVCVHGTTGYALTCTGPAEGFDSELADFDKVTRSFTFGAAAGEVFEDAAHHVRVHYPAGWRRIDVPAGAGTVLAVVPPAPAARGKQAALVTVGVDDIQPGFEKGGTAAFIDRMLGAARQLDPALRVLKSGEAKLGGRPAQRVVFTGKRAGVAYTRDVTVHIEGRKAYTLIGGCDPGEYDKLRSDFESMAQSFEWTQADAPAATPKEPKTDDLPF